MARGQMRQANLGPNPRFYGQSEDIRPWSSQFDFTSETEDYAYLAQTFELDRKRAKRTSIASADVETAKAERELGRRELMAQVSASYWAAVSTEAVASLLREDLKGVDEIVRYHKERVDAGAMRGVDLIRVQIERDKVLLTLQTAERDAAVARAELFRRMGRHDFASVRLTGDLSATAPVPLIDVDAALARRADIVVARDQLQAAKANVTLQKAMAVPDLDLAAGYKRNSADNTIYTSMNIPLPVRNRNQGEIERATAQVRLAEDNLQQTELAARADIEAARVSLERQRDIVTTVLPDIRSKAKENLDIMTKAYRLGGVDLLRYIDAERTEIDTEVTALRTLTEFQQSALQLQLALGEQP